MSWSWGEEETAKDYPMHRRSVRSTTHPTNLPFWSTEPDGLGSDNIASPKVNGRSSERRLTSSGNKYKRHGMRSTLSRGV
ncbi:hypothetical protein AYX14_04498 [Cryptococcus neoformans]|nr:hypothetical protein AYX14_04498 [Cryptococcus neoformans var. grubii]